ncbi:MAG: hypothetical protein AAF960_14570 [Bacteroidota bacterium]
MSARNQLFLKLFVLYAVLFGGMTYFSNVAFNLSFDWQKSVPFFLVFAAYLSFRRSRKMEV